MKTWAEKYYDDHFGTAWDSNKSIIVSAIAESYSAGAEQLRDRAATQAESMIGANRRAIADAIRALSVGESSRAPEGSKS